MEPRPSRPSKSTGQASTRTTRTPWTPSPAPETPTSQRTADIYSAPPNQSGGQWYGQQQGVYAPEPGDYKQTGPITPIKPRGERGNKLLRYLLASVLLIAVIGGGAYAITRYLNNDDDPNDSSVAAVSTSTVAPSDAPTQAPESQQAAPTATLQSVEPTATAEQEAAATEAPATDQVAASSDSEATVASEDAGSNASSDGASAYLPAADQLEGSWTISDEGERTKAEVAEQLGADGDSLLTGWGWSENVYRDLTLEDPTNHPDETTFVNVSVHQFDNPDGAAEALTYLSGIVVDAQGLQDVETPAIGDQARGLAGPGDGVNLYVLYVQDGNYLLRLGGASSTGDPAPTVNQLAEDMVAAQ